MAIEEIHLTVQETQLISLNVTETAEIDAVVEDVTEEINLEVFCCPPVPGAGWHSGDGAPGDLLGSNKDFYFDKLNNHIYGPKTGSSWTGTGPRPFELTTMKGVADGYAPLGSDSIVPFAHLRPGPKAKVSHSGPTALVLDQSHHGKYIEFDVTSGSVDLTFPSADPIGGGYHFWFSVLNTGQGERGISPLGSPTFTVFPTMTIPTPGLNEFRQERTLYLVMQSGSSAFTLVAVVPPNTPPFMLLDQAIDTNKDITNAQAGRMIDLHAQISDITATSKTPPVLDIYGFRAAAYLRINPGRQITFTAESNPPYLIQLLPEGTLGASVVFDDTYDDTYLIINKTATLMTLFSFPIGAIRDGETGVFDLWSGNYLTTRFNQKQDTLTHQDSVQESAGNVNLVNDAAAPGNDKYYGTNAGGVKGWYDLPSGSSLNFQYSITQSGSDVNLVNDSASPGNSKYYGTNDVGVRGFYDLTDAYAFDQSLSETSGTVTLLNDSDSPGNDKYYGTNGAGTKGWYDLTGNYTFQYSITESAGNVNLVNDSASPGNDKYYGTNGAGVRGFYDLPETADSEAYEIAKSGTLGSSDTWATITGWGTSSGEIDITEASGVFTINEDVRALVFIDLLGVGSGTPNRIQIDMKVRLDTGGGLTDQAKWIWKNYAIRNATQDEGGLLGVFWYDFSNGDEIDIQFRDVGTAFDLETDNVRLSIIALNKAIGHYDPGTWETCTYGTGWATADGRPLEAAKDSTGRVRLRGKAIRSSGSGTKVATLPSGMEPSESIGDIIGGDSGTGTGSAKWKFSVLEIADTGDIEEPSPFSNTYEYCFDGISFDTN